jgi:hypothetical protein
LGRKSQVGLAGLEERFSENIRIEQGVDVSHKPLPIDDVKKRREFLIGCSLDQRNSVMAKIVCVLYDDPVDGYPKSYARDDVPKIERYPGGQTLPTPKGIDFKPGALLGSVSGGLGLRKYLESNGHTFVVTSDKDGANSIFERELTDADVVISQPFWPAYLTA